MSIQNFRKMVVIACKLESNSISLWFVTTLISYFSSSIECLCILLCRRTDHGYMGLYSVELAAEESELTMKVRLTSL